MMPLYLSLLRHEGRRHARGLHRTGRLYRDGRPRAAAGRRPAAWTTGNWRPRRACRNLWNQVETDNINELTDSRRLQVRLPAPVRLRGRGRGLRRRSIRTRASTTGLNRAGGACRRAPAARREQLQQAVQPACLDGHVGLAPHRRLGMETHRQPRRPHHGQVVGAVAHGDRLLGATPSRAQTSSSLFFFSSPSQMSPQGCGNSRPVSLRRASPARWRARRPAPGAGAQRSV